MVINYLLLVHKSPVQVKRLIDSLQGADTNFYIHVDKNADIAAFKQEVKSSQNIKYVSEEERVAGQWGGIELVQATLRLMQMAANDHNQGYCILLSGQDYPLKSNAFIKSYLGNNKGTDFITFFPMPNAGWWPLPDGMARINKYLFRKSPGRYDFVLFPSFFEKAFYKPFFLKELAKLLIRGHISFVAKLFKPRRFPAYLQPYGGHQWWALTTETINLILLFLKMHPDYIRYHRDSLVPDEIFFQPIIKYLYGNSPTQPCLTYANWTRDVDILPVTFTGDDINELKTLPSHILFARKFDIATDDKILDMIDNLR